MTDMYDKECPLYAGHPVNTKCRGSQCAFSALKHKSTVNEDGNIRFENDGWYCIVRDFMLSISERGASE